MVCRELGIPASSIILNAAGKFTVLAHNTKAVKDNVSKIEGEINNWLIKNFFGQAAIGFSCVEASCNDFVSGKFPELWSKLTREVDKRKYSKFDIGVHGGCVETYLDSFDNEFGICPFCGKRPADGEAKVKDAHACKICRDHVYMEKTC